MRRYVLYGVGLTLLHEGYEVRRGRRAKLVRCEQCG